MFLVDEEALILEKSPMESVKEQFTFVMPPLVEERECVCKSNTEKKFH